LEDDIGREEGPNGSFRFNYSKRNDKCSYGLRFFLKNEEAFEWALRSGKLKGILKSLFD